MVKILYFEGSADGEEIAGEILYMYWRIARYMNVLLRGIIKWLKGKLFGGMYDKNLVTHPNTEHTLTYKK